MAFASDILSLWLIFAALGYSLRPLAVYAGILSAAHGAFFGVAVYAVTLLVTRGMTAPIAVVIGVLLAGVVASCAAAPALRLRQDHLVLATFAFAVVIHGAMQNLDWLTGGARGLQGLRVRSDHDAWTWFRLVVEASVLGATMWVDRLIASSSYGLLLRAIRDDEGLAASLGRRTFDAKLVAFAAAGLLAGLVGAAYSYRTTFVHPADYTVATSVLVLSVVIAGQQRRADAPMIGAFVLVVVPELTRLVGAPAAVAGRLRQLLFAVVLLGSLAFLARARTDPGGPSA